MLQFLFTLVHKVTNITRNTSSDKTACSGSIHMKLQTRRQKYHVASTDLNRKFKTTLYITIILYPKNAELSLYSLVHLGMYKSQLLHYNNLIQVNDRLAADDDTDFREDLVLRFSILT